jgi:hypothetical protein
MDKNRCRYCINYQQCSKDFDSFDTFDPCSCFSTNIDLTKKSEEEIRHGDRVERIILIEEVMEEE